MSLFLVVLFFENNEGTICFDEEVFVYFVTSTVGEMKSSSVFY
jgi:hypothetical protein